MTIEEMIAVLEAAKSRKQIQARLRGSEMAWEDVRSVGWDFVHYDYRVKPEPREFWINRYQIGSCCNIHPTLEAAIKGAEGQGPSITERIHVREVIE